MLRRIAAAALERAAAHFENALTPAELRRWVRTAGGDALAQADAADTPPLDAEDINGARVWAEGVAALRKFPRDPLPARLGPSLETLPFDDDGVRGAMEVLLRHIEIRKSECLPNWRGADGDRGRDYERLGIAMLCIRTARRSGDLRFLNAGWKMLEWFGARDIRGHGRSPSRFHRRLAVTTLECLRCFESAAAE